MISFVVFIRFETEAEKQNRLKEEAIAKEMANVAIAFKLSEPSPLYETVIPYESADPDSKTIFTSKVCYADKKAKPHSELSKSSKPSINVSSTCRPQTSASKQIKKTIEITHARPTTSAVRNPEKQIFPSIMKLSTVKHNTDNLQLPTKATTTGKQITGNRIIFETHVEQTEVENITQPKSKRLVKMQLSSGSSNFRYADGLERSPDIKVISPMKV